MARNKSCRTLIAAVETEGFRLQNVLLLFCFHARGRDKAALIGGIEAAFHQWSKTKEGAKYIEDNGCNWGDAINIPGEILRQHDIFLLENAITVSGRRDRLEYSLAAYRFENFICVDHNQQLVDE